MNESEIPQHAGPGDRREPPPTFADVAPALEFCCWALVGVMLWLRWANGPAVSGDQWAIQAFLATSAVTGAVALRWYNWRRLVGCVKDAPSDLSSNPKYMEGFGRGGE